MSGHEYSANSSTALASMNTFLISSASASLVRLLEFQPTLGTGSRSGSMTCA